MEGKLFTIHEGGAASISRQDAVEAVREGAIAPEPPEETNETKQLHRQNSAPLPTTRTLAKGKSHTPLPPNSAPLPTRSLTRVAPETKQTSSETNQSEPKPKQRKSLCPRFCASS